MQLTQNLRDVSRVYKRQLGDAPVHGVLMLWPTPPGSESAAAATRGQVTIVPGSRLGSWLTGLPSEAIPPAVQDEVWRALEGRVDKLDRHRLATDGAPRLGLQRRLLRWIGEPALGAVAALVVATLAADRGTLALAAALAGATLLGTFASSRSILRRTATSLAVTSAAIALATAVAAVVLALRP